MGGKSFKDQKFLTLIIKDFDTEDGLFLDDLAQKLIALLSRDCLENDEIQATYEQHMVDYQIENSLYSSLSSPFDTLSNTIKNEFKEDRVKINENLKVTKKPIIEYLEDMADDDGQLPFSFSIEDSETRDREFMKDVATAREQKDTGSVVDILSENSKRRAKRVSVSDLLKNTIITDDN